MFRNKVYQDKMQTIISNDYARIVTSARTKQKRVTHILGYTDPEPERLVRPVVRVIDPDPIRNPGVPGFPTPGTNPAITIIIIGQPGGPGVDDTPLITIPGSSTPPNDPGGSGDPGTGPGQNPGPGFCREDACIIGVVIIVDSSGNITHSAQSGNTTNGLNLKDLLVTLGLAPTEEGTHSFTFSFKGWRRKPNASFGEKWLSADDSYKVYAAGDDPFYSVT